MFQDLVSDLNKKFKSPKNTSGNLIYDPTRTFSFISSGDPYLDFNLGGGLALKGRLTQIASFESGGKTTLSLQTMFVALRDNPSQGAIYVDAEGHLDIVYMNALSNKIMGVDADIYHPDNNPDGRILVLRPASGEELDSALTMIFSKKNKNRPDLAIMVIDSVAAVRPLGLIDSDIEGSAQKAQHASFWSDFVPKLNLWAVKYNFAVILVNQLRAKLSMGFMDKFKLSNTGIANTGSATDNDLIATGGNALKFYLSRSYIIKFTSRHKIESVDPATGEIIKVEVSNKFVIVNAKDKVHTPYLKSPFMISYGEGTVNYYQAIDWAKDAGIISYKGNTYFVTINDSEVARVVGKANFNELLYGDSPASLDLRSKLESAFIAHLEFKSDSETNNIDEVSIDTLSSSNGDSVSVSV